MPDPKFTVYGKVEFKFDKVATNFTFQGDPIRVRIADTATAKFKLKSELLKAAQNTKEASIDIHDNNNRKITLKGKLENQGDSLFLTINDVPGTTERDTLLAWSADSGNVVKLRQVTIPGFGSPIEVYDTAGTVKHPAIKFMADK